MIAFRTYTNRLIDLEHPHVEDISIVDIALGLSNCCRFAGQIRPFYSVAQHSCLVATLVEPPLRLAALLHDASEAYLGDLSRNLKHHPMLIGYRVIEERVQDAIIERLMGHGTVLLPAAIEAIKVADDLAACWERVRVRERAAFDAMDDLPRLVAEGFVQSGFEEMLELTRGLPANFGDQWGPLPSTLAERMFLIAYGDYK